MRISLVVWNVRWSCDLSTEICSSAYVLLSCLITSSLTGSSTTRMMYAPGEATREAYRCCVPGEKAFLVENLVSKHERSSLHSLRGSAMNTMAHAPDL